MTFGPFSALFFFGRGGGWWVYCILFLLLFPLLSVAGAKKGCRECALRLRTLRAAVPFVPAVWLQHGTVQLPRSSHSHATKIPLRLRRPSPPPHSSSRISLSTGYRCRQHTHTTPGGIGKWCSTTLPPLPSTRTTPHPSPPPSRPVATVLAERRQTNTLRACALVVAANLPPSPPTSVSRLSSEQKKSPKKKRSRCSFRCPEEEDALRPRHGQRRSSPVALPRPPAPPTSPAPAPPFPLLLHLNLLPAPPMVDVRGYRRYRCGHCGLSHGDLRPCTGCYVEWYCSTVCQARHWETHRPRCLPQSGHRTPPKGLPSPATPAAGSPGPPAVSPRYAGSPASVRRKKGGGGSVLAGGKQPKQRTAARLQQQQQQRRRRMPPQAVPEPYSPPPSPFAAAAPPSPIHEAAAAAVDTVVVVAAPSLSPPPPPPGRTSEPPLTLATLLLPSSGKPLEDVAAPVVETEAAAVAAVPTPVPPPCLDNAVPEAHSGGVDGGVATPSQRHHTAASKLRHSKPRAASAKATRRVGGKRKQRRRQVAAADADADVDAAAPSEEEVEAAAFAADEAAAVEPCADDGATLVSLALAWGLRTASPASTATPTPDEFVVSVAAEEDQGKLLAEVEAGLPVAAAAAAATAEAEVVVEAEELCDSASGGGIGDAASAASRGSDDATDAGSGEALAMAAAAAQPPPPPQPSAGVVADTESKEGSTGAEGASEADDRQTWRAVWHDGHSRFLFVDAAQERAAWVLPDGARVVFEGTMPAGLAVPPLSAAATTPRASPTPTPTPPVSNPLLKPSPQSSSLGATSSRSEPRAVPFPRIVDGRGEPLPALLPPPPSVPSVSSLATARFADSAAGLTPLFGRLADRQAEATAAAKHVGSPAAASDQGLLSPIHSLQPPKLPFEVCLGWSLRFLSWGGEGVGVMCLSYCFRLLLVLCVQSSLS